ncbi:hypothetical protein CZ787_11505 [Halomonas citrativorans]|uniref:Uncharacterized protein n=1 Tax=Halomonas citrativorans TaxID=2742612 RepID=A0A1R4I1L2_9GAMM|nr:hypothetical protein CZ787_11505 [Halomonas citrativorans]
MCHHAAVFAISLEHFFQDEHYVEGRYVEGAVVGREYC